MSILDWRAVRALFDTICDLPAKQRQEVIDASGLGPQGLDLLQSMLDADARSDIGENVHAHAPQVVEAMAQDSRIGSLVGAWRIEALIGVGGMGRVYRAHREDGCYEGLAAIKFVAEAANPGFFAHERHVLARLTHPGIARLLDAGEDAQASPYLVMEYIAGSSIRDHCRAIGDARARIAVVRAAAQAIAHAHAQLVLHRDLKPANLMVDTQGQVKVLDFGVAKLLDRTSADPQQTAARYFTLRYAAPEQIAGEPTGTGVDIYALALILYELLADEHPFAAQPQTGRSLAERVLAGDATPLRRCLASRNDPMLAGFAPDRARDLEAVLARALSRDPSARYASVMEFADELGRVLDDLPVLARAGTAAATLARLARRHRVAMALGTFALLSLAVLSLVAVWQAERAARERDLSQHEAVRAERIADFLTGLFEASQPLRNQGPRTQRTRSARQWSCAVGKKPNWMANCAYGCRQSSQTVTGHSATTTRPRRSSKAALAVDTTLPEGSRRKAECCCNWAASTTSNRAGTMPSTC
ncbi:MAG: serine/threonine protein kinase [Ahniella sp.]|nr:serine/threonine protein kinase [Ahniella sp.]